MKRSKYVQLSLAASVAMAISGCGPTEKTYDLQKKYNFQSVQQCADEKLPVDVCSDAYMTAMAEHRRIAPVYDSQADCDADFVADWCQQDSTGKFIPRLGGFELTAEGQVTQTQVDAANAQAANAQASGGSGLSGCATGPPAAKRGGAQAAVAFSKSIYVVLKIKTMFARACHTKKQKGVLRR